MRTYTDYLRSRFEGLEYKIEAKQKRPTNPLASVRAPIQAFLTRAKSYPGAMMTYAF